MTSDDKSKRSKKYTDFTHDDIKSYLEKFRRLVSDGKYIISKGINRQENINFIDDYKINTKKEREILLGLQYDDFCYVADNEKEDYSYEKLYIFCKCQELDHWGALEKVDIYIKINMVQTRSGDDFVIVVSFHKKDKSLKYLFR